MGILSYRDTEFFRKEFSSFNDQLEEQTQNIEFARLEVTSRLEESLQEGEAQWLKRAAAKVAGSIKMIEQTALICVKNGIVSRYVQADADLRTFIRGELNAYLDDLIDAYQLSEIVIVDNEGQEIARRGEFIVPEGGDPILDGFELANKTTNEKYSGWFKQISQSDVPEGFYYDLYSNFVWDLTLK